MIDELPAYLGGRSNSWRRLNLKGNSFYEQLRKNSWTYRDNFLENTI